MALQEVFIERELQFVAKITCDDIGSEPAIDRAFDDLEAALARILERAGDDKIYWFTFLIEEKGAEPVPHQTGNLLTSCDPWESFCPAFWDNACRFPGTRDRVRRWLRELEFVLKRSVETGQPSSGLWEYDQAQFGEPILTYLACTDPEFVPAYTSLLRLWDMDHEVHQNMAIAAMVNRHGITPDIETLLYVRVAVQPGQTGSDIIEELLPTLDKAHGDFVASDLFRKIVFHHYARSFLRSGLGTANLDFTTFNYSGDRLKTGEARLLSELAALSGNGQR